jgi:hypothetical protein
MVSYLLNLPLSALAAIAGYDKDHLDEEQCAHLDADPNNELTDKVWKAWLPFLVAEDTRVDAAFEKCTNNVQAKDDRLFCARGVADAFILMARIFVRCAAARPRLTGACHEHASPC